jgi:hypothetical protein
MGPSRSEVWTPTGSPAIPWLTALQTSSAHRQALRRSLEPPARATTARSAASVPAPSNPPVPTEEAQTASGSPAQKATTNKAEKAGILTSMSNRSKATVTLPMAVNGTIVRVLGRKNTRSGWITRNTCSRPVSERTSGSRSTDSGLEIRTWSTRNPSHQDHGASAMVPIPCTTSPAHATTPHATLMMSASFIGQMIAPEMPTLLSDFGGVDRSDLAYLEADEQAEAAARASRLMGVRKHENTASLPRLSGRRTKKTVRMTDRVEPEPALGDA